MLEDPALAEKANLWIDEAVLTIVDASRGEIAALIETTVAAWDPYETSRRIELQIGRDLQFVRINGTIVGAMVGLTLYALTKRSSYAVTPSLRASSRPRRRPEATASSSASGSCATSTRCGSGFGSSASASTSSIVLTNVKRHRVAHFVGDVAKVLLVRFGHDHEPKPGAVRREHFFLHAADLENLSAQRDFAREREIATHGAPAEHARDRERDRGTRRTVRPWEWRRPGSGCARRCP